MLKLLVKIRLRGCVIFLKNCTFLKCYNFVMLVTPLVQIEFFSTCYSPQWLLKKIGWVEIARRAPKPFNFYNSQFKKIVCIQTSFSLNSKRKIVQFVAKSYHPLCSPTFQEGSSSGLESLQLSFCAPRLYFQVSNNRTTSIKCT